MAHCRVDGDAPADIAAIKRIAGQGNVKLWIALALTALLAVAPQILSLPSTEQPATETEADTDGEPEHTQETDTRDDPKSDLGS